jgi:hypothetical protein
VAAVKFKLKEVVSHDDGLGGCFFIEGVAGTSGSAGE